ncbi:DUF3857 domain-containing protein [Altererythrobacter fulvus]|uniref:DUF3857 domain-containing protein n=1 Tax=Caenibius fulvus TaxID=2126012 RepID=UPI003015D032
MTRASRFGLVTVLLCSAAPVLAGENPLYQPAPDWVEPIALADKDLTSGPAVLLADVQKRLDGAKVWDYRDIAFRLDSPDSLASAGTLSASWIPDKGDIIINRVEILRGGEVVDVLAQGARFTVLRREAQLEQRSINGLLTATLAVPGLRVGDVLRVAYTTVQADQALGNKVQSIDSLPVAPLQIGHSRVRVSWPDGADVQWRAGPGAEDVQPVEQGGYKVLEIDLPLAEMDEMPADAPLRFRRTPLLQVGSFSGWQDVSKTLAPHFATEGSIDPKGEIAAKTDAIMKTTRDPLARAAAALRIVQDDVSYLANGLDGGNYLPQKPEETWQLRYGDCKAKSLLLLAMLRRMGISADVVVVHSTSGDAAPDLLPMPADFDHMIVRATIGGEDYWLDGTASGTRLSNIGEVPPFRYALPINAQGSDLVEMVQRPLAAPDRTLELTLDQSAGVDLPSLYSVRVEMTGALGAMIRSLVAQPDATYQSTFVDSFMDKLIGNGSMLEYSLSYDEDTAHAVITASGITQPMWTFERGIAREYLPAMPSSDFAFAPDRARKAWRDIPVQMAGPYGFSTKLKLVLPEGGVGYEVRGREIVDTEIAGTRVKREALLDKGTLTVKEEVVSRLMEVAPADVTAEKAKAARFAAGKLSLRAPETAKRQWEVTPQDRARLAPIEDAYAALIAKDPDAAQPYLDRAAFRSGILDWQGALEDVDEAIALEPTSASWFSRADLLARLGKLDESLEAVRKAFEIDPTPQNALAEAQAMAEIGDVGEALDLVETYEDDFEDRFAAIVVKANLLGMSGKAEQGLQLLDRLLVERPGDPEVLNNLCWHMSVWQVREDAMLAQCTRAVEGGGWSPPVLDSRAMAYFRLGRMEEALTDLNAALSSEPGLANSLFMRGIVRAKLGDKDGTKDVDMALRLDPSLKATYARYGIEAPGN